MNQIGLFDPSPIGHVRRVRNGVERKRAGQAQAAEHAGAEWRVRILQELRTFCAVRLQQGRPEFAFEEFREWVASRRLPAPTHHNAWGALPGIAARAGMIEATGEYRPAKSAKTRAHPVLVWRVRHA